MQYFTFLWILISFSRASSISFGNEKVNKINPSQQKMNWNNSSLRRKLRRRKKRRRWRREEWMKNPNEQGDHQFHRSGGYNVLTARRHFTLYRVNRWQANLLLFCPIHSSTSAHVPPCVFISVSSKWSHTCHKNSLLPSKTCGNTALPNWLLRLVWMPVSPKVWPRQSSVGSPARSSAWPRWPMVGHVQGWYANASSRKAKPSEAVLSNQRRPDDALWCVFTKLPGYPLPSTYS